MQSNQQTFSTYLSFKKVDLKGSLMQMTIFGSNNCSKQCDLFNVIALGQIQTVNINQMMTVSSHTLTTVFGTLSM